MKYTRRPLLPCCFIIGVFSAAIWSAHLGKRVWSPRVFAWPNPLRQPPGIELQADCPLLITNPRYYSFVSIGSAVAGVLNFDITNTSNKPVHSYEFRYYSPVSVGNGSYGTQPNKGLLPGQLHHGSISAHEYAPLTLTIDFVQFSDGTTWLASSPQPTIKTEGLNAGAKAAATYLLGVMNRDGVQTVMATLPRIHAEVREPYGTATKPEFGIFGFYAGVTNTTVRLEHEYKDGEQSE